VPLSALDSIPLAFQHAKQQLIQPFRISQWAKLALVGFLAGELSSGGCSVPNFHFPIQSNPNGTDRLLGLPQLPSLNPAVYAALIATLIVTGVILWVLFMYVSSVMRFVLFDSVLKKYCAIRESWHQRQGHGLRLFAWQIGVSLCFVALLAIVVGIPAAVAFAAGWFQNPGQHLAPLILIGLFVFLVAALVTVVFVIVHVFTKDFVVPQMALENISALEGWRRLLPMLNTDKGGYAGYAALKVVVTLAAAVVIGIVTTILILIMFIPIGGISAVILLGGKAAGLTWNLYTITLAIVVASILLLLIIYMVSFVSVPPIVFFPAYSMYFFADRYRRLQLNLYPHPLVITPAPPEPTG
jgi:hypothetical protein